MNAPSHTGGGRCAGGSFATFFDGEVEQYFCLPAHNVAIRLHDQQLVLFDSSIPHCASRPHGPGHVYSIVPVCPKKQLAAQPTGMHAMHAPRLLLPLCHDSTASDAHVRGPHQMRTLFGHEWEAFLEACSPHNGPHSTSTHDHADVPEEGQASPITPDAHVQANVLGEGSASSAPQTSQVRATCDGPPTLHVVELYADTSPTCKFAHSALTGYVVHTLAVDWHTHGKCIGPVRAGCSHHHIQFNLNHLELRDLAKWTADLWGITPQAVDWYHLSFDCTPQSLAGACKAVHRSKGTAPVTPLAHQSDITISENLTIMDGLVQQSPRILITAEQPWHSIFTAHLDVRTLLLTRRWQLVRSSHCKSATLELDGEVTDDAHCPALFPQKHSVWLVAGVPPYAELSTCVPPYNCRMLVPGGAAHRLLISRPAEGMRPGQRVMKPSEDKARIPLGTMAELWEWHSQVRERPDMHYYQCCVCGHDDCPDGDPLLLCEGTVNVPSGLGAGAAAVAVSCKRVQHLTCSGGSPGDPVPLRFLCVGCTQD